MSELKVRASSWPSVFDCAHRFEGEQILGMRKPSGLRAQLGTSVHAGTAAFDQAVLDGARITPDEAAEHVMDSLHHPKGEVDYKQDENLTLKDAERIALTLHTMYCTTVAPQFVYESVEMTLEPYRIDCGNDLVIVLTGSMDRARVATTERGVVIPDIKTGLRIVEQGAVNLKGKAAQCGTYQLMFENTTSRPTAGSQIIALPTSTKPVAMVSPIFDAKRVMVGTDESPGLIEYAAAMFKTGLFPPNPSSTLCSQKYCARWNSCSFHA